MLTKSVELLLFCDWTRKSKNLNITITCGEGEWLVEDLLFEKEYEIDPLGCEHFLAVIALVLLNKEWVFDPLPL